MKRENADYATERASARRRKRTREMRTFALLVCLVVMTAVLYLAVSIFSWIDGRMKDGEGAVLPVIGDGVENPDAAGSVSGGDASDGSQSGDGSGESSGAVSGAGSNSVVYSQEDLEGYMAVAKAEAAEEVLDSIRRGLNDGGSLLETLRPLFPEEMIVYSGGKYNFVPINRSLKQSVLVEENLNILETGEYQYLQDGQVISHKGIDVSKHQGVIDWNLVAQDGVEFAFIRVGNRGYGTGKMVEDERFDANIQGASAAGIKVGVYYYSQLHQLQGTDNTAFRILFAEMMHLQGLQLCRRHRVAAAQRTHVRHKYIRGLHLHISVAFQINRHVRHCTDPFFLQRPAKCLRIQSRHPSAYLQKIPRLPTLRRPMQLCPKVEQGAAELPRRHADDGQPQTVPEGDPACKDGNAVQHLRNGKGQTAHEHPGKQPKDRLPEAADAVQQTHVPGKPFLPPCPQLTVSGKNTQDAARERAENHHLLIYQHIFSRMSLAGEPGHQSNRRQHREHTCRRQKPIACAYQNQKKIPRHIVIHPLRIY